MKVQPTSRMHFVCVRLIMKTWCTDYPQQKTKRNKATTELLLNVTKISLFSSVTGGQLF